jgi:hypothetical protein
MANLSTASLRAVNPLLVNLRTWAEGQEAVRERTKGRR